MKVSYLLLIGCLLFCVSCKENEKESLLPVLELEASLASPKELSLDDICESVEYVPLETTEENLIKYISQVVVADEIILVVHDNKCSLYSRDGKYLRQIGSQGGGPNEYNSIVRLFLDGDEIVLIDHARRLIRYNRNGEFSGSYKMDVPSFDDFYMFDKDLYITYHDNKSGSDKIRFYFLDTTLSVVDSVPYTQQYESEKGISVRFYTSNILSKYVDRVHCKEMLNDTIFSIDREKNIESVAVLSTGRFAPNPADRYHLINTQQKVFSDKKMPMIISETLRYTFLTGMGMKMEEIVVWDKNTNEAECVIIHYGEKEQKIFEKDIFIPRFASEDHRMVITYELSPDIDNEDNPTLLLVTLKE
ncbi:6-bladed beta-propeller [Parabacteroides sp. OttesenSCG-928-J18]|nr:6-bladed beta-propeller [Parabacteroides sp. OttesenSCG-928-J18]